VTQLGYSSDILYLVDLFLSKCSVCLLFIRLTSNNAHIKLFQALLGFTTVWMIVSVFIVALRCDLSQPWIQYDGSCSGLVRLPASRIHLCVSNVVAVSKMDLHHNSERHHRGFPIPRIGPFSGPATNGSTEKSDCDGGLRFSTSVS
jgi:hypothetical protein